MPGYTHGQRAQPVWLGQHLAAHGWALARDLRAAAARCGPRPTAAPLGAGALAGSSLPLDPDWVAQELGFSSRVRKPAGRRLRSRLRVRAGVRRGALHGAPVAAIRGAGAVDVGRVRLRRARRLGRHRLLDDAAEEEPRRGRADPRQGGHRGRAPGRAAGDAEGAPARLQPRPAGGQAGRLRSGRRPDRGARLADASACAGSASTPSGWPRRPATASPSPPTWPSSWCARACRSAKPTSGGVAGCRPASASASRRPSRRRGPVNRPRRWPISWTGWPLRWA